MILQYDRFVRVSAGAEITKDAPDSGLPIAVRLDNVTCLLGRRKALQGVSLNVRLGEVFGLLGPNGAGKTTTLSLIMDLHPPSSGQAVVLGERLPSRCPALRRRIGVVFQETALYDEMTAWENLRFAASLYSVPDPEQRITEVLDLLALSARSKEPVRNLSGGLRRRVTIARALLHDPELIVIDEPTLGVDVEARHAIWQHLRLLRSTGTTIVVATNYLDEAIALCDTVAVLREGRLIAVDKPDALVARAGCCLDVECDAEAGKTLAAAFHREPGVLRIAETATGLSVFIAGGVVPDQVLRTAQQAAPLRGFRTRGADLEEVFQALGDVP